MYELDTCGLELGSCLAFGWPDARGPDVPGVCTELRPRRRVNQRLRPKRAPQAKWECDETATRVRLPNNGLLRALTRWAVVYALEGRPIRSSRHRSRRHEPWFLAVPAAMRPNLEIMTGPTDNKSASEAAGQSTPRDPCKLQAMSFFHTLFPSRAIEKRLWQEEWSSTLVSTIARDWAPPLRCVSNQGCD